MASRLLEDARPAMAGLAGGSLATLTLHPLDLLKTRQSVHGNGADKKARETYSSLGRAVRTIVAQEGGLRGLYAGVGANVLVSGSSWGIYFTSYGAIKNVLVGGAASSGRPLRTSEQIIAAFGAGTVTTLLSNPLSVVRTRMVLRDARDKRLTGVIGALKSITKEEGVRGLYKGVFPSLLGVSHGAIQLLAYEKIKEGIRSWKNKDELDFCETLAACATSKVIAAIQTYPCQNVRACQQAAVGATNAQTGALAILKREGVRGLYRGLGPYLLHVVPNVCLVFMVYEAIVGPSTGTKAK